MLKKSASGVLARHCRLIISAASTSLTLLFVASGTSEAHASNRVGVAPSLAAALLDGVISIPLVLLRYGGLSKF
jgi:hypothetical protein